jgi:hypothetical protein
MEKFPHCHRLTTVQRFLDKESRRYNALDKRINAEKER